MVFESVPCWDSKEIIREKKSGSSYIISFSGSCKWSVNYGVRATAPAIDVEAMSEAEIERRSDDYWECSLRAKSEVLQCEIMVHYWSEESGFDQFDHYKNGKLLKQRKIGYDYEEQTEFDWDRLEFVGHEGEYDESVDGEQQDADLMSLLAMLGGGGAPAEEEPETDGDDEHIDPDDLLRQLGDLLNQLQDAAAEAGTDPNSSLIGDAGFDMYDWTFTEGTRKKEKGWSVAIPDGFKVIPSKDGRLFEAVPEGTENYGKDDVPISILPGIEIKSDTITGNNWMYHPYARAGVAEIVAVQMAGGLAKLFGTAPEILSAGFSDASYSTVPVTPAPSRIG